MSADKDMRVAVIAGARTPFAKARADLREYSGDQGRSCGIVGQAEICLRGPFTKPLAVTSIRTNDRREQP